LITPLGFLIFNIQFFKTIFLWIQCGIIILGNLLSLNVWLFIHFFYLIGHWGNWSLQLYHNPFAITGQFDKYSFFVAFHLTWSIRLYQFRKVCNNLHSACTVKLTKLSIQFQCLTFPILKTQHFNSVLICLIDFIFLSFTCCNMHVNLLKCQLDQQSISRWLNLSFILTQCQFDFSLL
jgi:hypothetical protein